MGRGVVGIISRVVEAIPLWIASDCSASASQCLATTPCGGLSHRFHPYEDNFMGIASIIARILP